MNDVIEMSPDVRAGVFELEKQMQEREQRKDLEVFHHFSPGLYGRELRIPAGTGLTGAIQKYACANFLLKGDITVLTKDGMQRVQGPWSEITPAGTKRIGRTHADCIWITYYTTDETDPDKIVEAFTTNSEQEYLTHREQLKLKGK
jgi:hypothetical protein